MIRNEANAGWSNAGLNPNDQKGFPRRDQGGPIFQAQLTGGMAIGSVRMMRGKGAFVVTASRRDGAVQRREWEA